MITQEKNIHWYPGHMKKAQNEIETKVKLVDVVIEVLDARAPFSSRNKFFNKLAINKPHLIVLNKADLAAVPALKTFDSLKITPDDLIISCSCNDKSAYKKICDGIKLLGEKKNAKFEARGMKKQAIRALIFGIPNVGKSSLINILAKKKIVGVANTPGFTRGEQWIKVNDDFNLLDTPGILPSRFDEPDTSLKLAVLGSIPEDILPLHTLDEYIFNILKFKYLCETNTFFKVTIENETNYQDFLDKVARANLFLLKNNEIDINRTEQYILKYFQNGKICKVFID
jgi:ribosome biogenesis GTPase A